jgi:acetoacetyl-CoA synthetase
VARDLTVVDVPGHHGDVDDDRVGMLSEQHVGTLAARVSATLR